MKIQLTHKRAVSDAKYRVLNSFPTHRRVQSNVTSKDFRSSLTRRNVKGVSEFLGLLDAADSYFSEESDIFALKTDSELDLLAAQLEEEKIKTETLEQEIDRKQKEFVSLSKYIEEKRLSISELETSVKSQNNHLHSLDLEISRALHQLPQSHLLPSASSHQTSPVPIKYKPLSVRMSRPHS